MIELTNNDHKNIRKMRNLFRIRAWSHKKDGLLQKQVERWCNWRIEILDKKYFKTRLKKVCEEENILRISTGQSPHQNFNMFHSLISGGLR